MKKQLQIRIFPNGSIDAKTHGIKGPQCTDYIKTLEQLLSARVIESCYTDEYYQTQTFAEEVICENENHEQK